MQLSQIKKTLRAYDIRPTKKKGQNFLVKTSYLTKMIEAGQVTKKDTVVEVGPGLGVLTKELSESAKTVIAIELDKKISGFLQEEFLPSHKNVTLIEGDVLSSAVFHQLVATLYKEQVPDAVINPKDISYQEVLESLEGEYKLIANLPYQITSKVLRQFLESKPRPSQLVIMLQKEVAERILAKPGKMSLLALSVQAYSEASIITKVPASAYFPKPEVDSAILHCDLTKGNLAYAGLDEKGQKLFWRLAKAGFSSKRKQLQNNLRSVLKNNDTEAFLVGAGLNKQVRAQELSVDDWVRLVELLHSDEF